MRKMILTALTLSLVTVATAAPMTSVTAAGGEHMGYEGLYTESGWQAVNFDLSDADLAALAALGSGEISTTDLKVNLVVRAGNGEAVKSAAISLLGLRVEGNVAYARILIDRKDRAEGVNALVGVQLLKGGVVIAERDVMVYGGFAN